MNKEVSDRLQLINNNIEPIGYKTIKGYILPKDWNVDDLGNIMEFKNGLNYKANDSGESIKIVGVGDFKDNFYLDTEVIDYIDVNNLGNDYLLHDGDLLFVRSNGNKELIGRVLYYNTNNEKVTFSGFTIRGRLHSNDMIDKYCAYYCSSNLVKSQYMKNGGGTNISNLSQGILSDLDIIKPSMNEQKKIINIIEVWDRVIELKEKLLEEKLKHKKGLMERLLTGKVRLNGFNDEVKFNKLKSYINEIKIKNKENKEKRILSVTNKHGFILQEEQFDRIVASSDVSNYKIVKKGQFAYNPSRVNVGSLDLLTKFESGLLSPMYVIFECNDKLNKDYLHQFLKSNMFLNVIPRLLQGSVRDSLSFEALQQVKLFIPKFEEQRSIAKILKTSDKEIDLLKKEIELLKEQKKGLMQLLLTGIVRV